MLQIKNTICCPQCEGILRVRVNVVSDGNNYEYYLCSKCEDVARKDRATGEWVLRGQATDGIPEVVTTLQSLAVEDWSERSARPESTVKIESPNLPRV
jgi:hypothetical protein